MGTSKTYYYYAENLEVRGDSTQALCPLHPDKLSRQYDPQITLHS